MARTPRGLAFDQHEPDLTEDEIKRAKASGKIALSFKGKPVLTPEGDIGFIAVKFALANGAFVTVLMDQFSGRLLHGLIQAANQVSWKTDVVKPSGAAH